MQFALRQCLKQSSQFPPPPVPKLRCPLICSWFCSAFVLCFCWWMKVHNMSSSQETKIDSWSTRVEATMLHRRALLDAAKIAGNWPQLLSIPSSSWDEKLRAKQWNCEQDTGWVSYGWKHMCLWSAKIVLQTMKWPILVQDRSQAWWSHTACMNLARLPRPQLIHETSAAALHRALDLSLGGCWCSHESHDQVYQLCCGLNRFHRSKWCQQCQNVVAKKES